MDIGDDRYFRSNCFLFNFNFIALICLLVLILNSAFLVSSQNSYGATEIEEQVFINELKSKMPLEKDFIEAEETNEDEFFIKADISWSGLVDYKEYVKKEDGSIISLDEYYKEQEVSSKETGSKSSIDKTSVSTPGEETIKNGDGEILTKDTGIQRIIKFFRNLFK